MRTVALLMLALVRPAAATGPLGPEASACVAGGGAAILATLTGLKDTKGDLKLELYPATADDFLKDDRDLIAAGRTFRRVRIVTPHTGSVQLCIRVPRPGRYALLATHDRDGHNKFNIFSDGAGFPSNRTLGRSRPKLDEALIDVGTGVAKTTIRMQYLRGLRGFAPLDD